MSRSELKKTISDLRTVLGGFLQVKRLDVIALPCSNLVLKRSSSESKKTITQRVLLTSFQTIFTSHESTDATSVADLSSAVQQNLRESITTVRHYGDVLEGSSAAAKRKPRGVAELKSGTFGPSDTETVQLCEQLGRVKQQLVDLPPSESQRRRSGVREVDCGERCGSHAESVSQEGHGGVAVVASDGECLNGVEEVPTKPVRRTRRSFKVFEANMLIENICTTIMLGRQQMPSWDSVSEQIEKMVEDDLSS